MQRQPMVQRCAWSLAVVILSGAVALAQQKHRLKDVDLPGDLSSVESTLEMTLDVQAQSGGQTFPTLKFVNNQVEKYTEEVLTTDKRGASGVRRVYSVSRSEDTDPSGARK